MISRIQMLAMEEIIVDHAGPLGKFVIKKAIADMGSEPESYDEDTIERFVDLVLKRAIFDQGKWKSVREEILNAWGR